jgi:hypothetical protein
VAPDLYRVGAKESYYIATSLKKYVRKNEELSRFFPPPFNALVFFNPGISL